MRVRSAPLRHRVRHRFCEAPRESGLSLKVFTKRSMMQRGRKDCEASWELEVIFATVWMCLSGFLGLGMNLK